MRCFVTGAYGFIGREIVRALRRQGLTVICGGRDLELGRRLIPGCDWRHTDYNQLLTPEDWRPRLADIDVVINCVGILQSTHRDDIQRIHTTATEALFEACEAANIQKLVHISAMSAETEIDTAYAQSKVEADRQLENTALNWVIVKPSLVIGRGSFGGTSLIRGLAGLPLILPIPGSGKQKFQPIALEDLANGIANLVDDKQFEPVKGTTLFAAGPSAEALSDIFRGFRRWLGFSRARPLHIPLSVLKPALWFGDFLGWLGHNTAMRSTSMRQLTYDRIVDPMPFEKATGIRLRNFQEILEDQPATIQDRLHARLFFWVPLLQFLIAGFWIVTGVITFVPQVFAAGVDVLLRGGVSATFANVLVALGAVGDIVLGILFLLPRTVRLSGIAQIALIMTYLLVLSVLRPDLWGDPLGPLLKVIPLIGAIALVVAAQEKR